MKNLLIAATLTGLAFTTTQAQALSRDAYALRHCVAEIMLDEIAQSSPLFGELMAADPAMRPMMLDDLKSGFDEEFTDADWEWYADNPSEVKDAISHETGTLLEAERMAYEAFAMCVGV